MTQVNIEDIQRDPSKYLQRVEAGESLLILRAGKPVAEVNPISGALKAARPFGLCAGKFTVPDDFDAPLPEDILRSFEPSQGLTGASGSESHLNPKVV